MNGYMGLTKRCYLKWQEKMKDWDKIQRECTALDLINIGCCFELSPERREWLKHLLRRKLQEEGFDEDGYMRKRSFPHYGEGLEQPCGEQ